MLNKISNRILLGFSVPIIFLIILGTSIAAIDKKVIELEKDMNQTSIQIKNTNELTYALARILGIIRAYVLDPGDTLYIRDYNYTREIMLNSKRSLQDIKDRQARNAIDELIKVAEEYEQISAGVFPLVNANQREEAKRIVIQSHLLRVEDLRKEVIELLEQRLEKNKGEIKQGQGAILILTILGTLLTIAVTVLVAWWVVLPLSRKMPTIIDAADKIAEGDLRQTVEVTRDGTELEKLLVAFRNMSRNLNVLIQNLQKSGIQITTSTTQIAASGKQLEATVTEQAASTNQVAATAKEISATSQ
ncbi:MAG TPA: methyl-accepting chemotaxis protein, partial [Leptolyngbyaceae cyanobacterium]